MEALEMFLNGEDPKHFECGNRAFDHRDGKLFCNCCGQFICEEQQDV